MDRMSLNVVHVELVEALVLLVCHGRQFGREYVTLVRENVVLLSWHAHLVLSHLEGTHVRSILLLVLLVEELLLLQLDLGEFGLLGLDVDLLFLLEHVLLEGFTQVVRVNVKALTNDLGSPTINPGQHAPDVFIHTSVVTVK